MSKGGKSEESSLPILLQGRRCDIQIRTEKKLF